MRNPSQHGKYLANSYECMSRDVPACLSGGNRIGELIGRRRLPSSVICKLQLLRPLPLDAATIEPQRRTVAPVHVSTRLRIELRRWLARPNALPDEWQRYDEGFQARPGSLDDLDSRYHGPRLVPLPP